jgi:periplasmic protein TonB
MFEMSLVEGRARTHRGWTVIVSFLLQVTLVVAALLIPLVRPDLLPVGLVARIQLMAPPGPPPAPPPPAAAPIAAVKRAVRQFVAGRLLEPSRVPQRAALIEDDMHSLATAPGFFVEGGIPGGAGGAGAASIFGEALAAPPPPPAIMAEPKAQPRVRRIEVGGNVIEAKLIHPVPQPVYPPLAKQTRTQGVVVLAALIGPDGRIRNLRVLTGHPLLTQAAMDAVRQWRYHPTLLNGEPAEVDTTVEVRFVLRSY